MMKLVKLLYVVFMIIGLIRCDMNRMEIQKSEMQKIGETSKGGMKKQETGSACANPFKLDEMGVSLTDTKRMEGSGEDAIEYHNVKLITQSDLDPENVACKYQMYCSTVQA